MSPPIAVLPGVSVGPFTIAASLRDTVQIAKETLRGVVRVKLPQFDESDAATFTSTCSSKPSVVVPMHLRSDRDGMTLLIDPVEQILEAVLLTDLRSCELMYHGVVLCGPLTPPTFHRIYDVLGPTFSGKLNPSTSQYVLSYPGIYISFPVPVAYHSHFQTEQLLTKLPNGFVPIAESMMVCAERTGHREPGTTTTTARSPLPSPTTSIASRTVVPPSLLVAEEVDLLPTVGVVFRRAGLRIPFGSTTPQSLVGLLGPPTAVLNKFDRRLAIHNPALRGQSDAPVSYHFAYPLFGLDFTFSARHRLEKVTAWSPRPMHESFLNYHTCWYRAPLPQPYWGPDQYVTARCTMEGLESATKRRLPPSLLSSSGCANGLVMRIVALDGIVLYAMPSGELLRVMVLANAIVDSTRFPYDEWPEATDRTTSPSLLALPVPELPPLPVESLSTHTLNGAVGHHHLNSGQPSLWDDDTKSSSSTTNSPLPPPVAPADSNSPMLREETAAAAKEEGESGGAFYDPTSWSDAEQSEEDGRAPQYLEKNDGTTSQLQQQDEDAHSPSTSSSHSSRPFLSVPPALDSLRHRHTDPHHHFRTEEDGNDDDDDDETKPKQEEEEQEEEQRAASPFTSSPVTNPSHYSEDFEHVTTTSEGTPSASAAQHPLGTAGASQYSALSSTRGDATRSVSSPLGGAEGGELLGSWWPHRDDEDDDEEEAATSRPDLTSAVSPAQTEEDADPPDTNEDEDDEDDSTDVSPSPPPPPAPAKGAGGKTPSPPLSNSRKPSPPPQQPSSKKNKKKKGRR